MTLFSPTIKERIESALSNYYQKHTKIQLNPVSDSEPSPATPADLKQKKETETQALLLETVTNNSFVQQLQKDCNAEILEKDMTFTSNIL